MSASRIVLCASLLFVFICSDVPVCGAQPPPVSLNTSQYASLNEALAALTAAGGGVLVIDSPAVLRANAEAPDSVLLRFVPGGSVDLGTNFLALNCQVQAEATQIFHNVANLSGTITDSTVLPQWFGARADGQTDDALALQTTLNLAAGGSRALITKGQAPYKTGPVAVRNDSEIELEEGTVIEAIPGLAEEVRLINIADVSNVSISGNGAVIKMLKEEYVSGEQRHAVDIVGASNVTIADLAARDSGGDGFYIGPSRTPGGLTYSKGVSLTGCVADNNRRQGLSIISGENIVVDGCVFMNTIGADPQSGVDLEPDSNVERLVNINIANCRFANNAVSGLVISLTSLDQSSLPYSIQVTNCLSMNNAIGVYLRCIKPGVQGQLILLGMDMKDNKEEYRLEACLQSGMEKLNVISDAEDME